jgi:hypothetical protein
MNFFAFCVLIFSPSSKDVFGKIVFFDNPVGGVHARLVYPAHPANPPIIEETNRPGIRSRYCTPYVP